MARDSGPPTFEFFSVANASYLAAVAAERGCDCTAYIDWFKFKDWIKQGRVVQKGEKGTRIPTMIEVKGKDDDGELVVRGRRMWSAAVFCRCQTVELEEKAA